MQLNIVLIDKFLPIEPTSDRLRDFVNYWHFYVHLINCTALGDSVDDFAQCVQFSRVNRLSCSLLANTTLQTFKKLDTST